MIEFKILNEPKQRFSVILAERRVTFDIWYNQTSDRWSFDMALDGEPVLSGRRIVTGVDLLAPFNFDIGALFAFSSLGDVPNRDNLPNGVTKLYYATQDEIDAAVAA
ncbi:hypothetical protein EVC26_051 [Rhizobium phage RHph_I72]|nr:hypothetical protein EVC13_049 [Rhizobium phage RHph_I65]QIG76497.1 hypothetical protein EVC26_051 [Rhizobium phage RHph_I72]